MQPGDSQTLRKKLLLAAITAAVVILFILLFVAANPQWVPVYFPAMPWSAARVSFGFETRIHALIGSGALIGFGLAVALLWPILFRTRRQLRQEQHRNGELTRDLQRTERLFTHSQKENAE
jgi:hypothetical protein